MTGEPLEVRATNGAAFAAALTRATAAVTDMSGPMAAVGQLVLAAAVAGSPRRTGATAGAHTVRAQGRNRVRLTVATPYAAAIHWGWPAHGIKRQPWVVGTFNRNTAWMDAMEAKTQAALDAAAAAT